MAADTIQIGFTASSSDGVTANMRGGRLNDLIISQHSPRHAELTIRGRSYSVSLLATTGTVAAGNINLAAAAASTQFALWNPAATGVNVILKKLMFGINSGTPAPGPLLHNVFTTTIPTIASVGTAVNSLVSTAAYNGQAKFVASAGGTALTGGSALLLLRPSTISFSGVYSAPGGSAHFEEIDGDIVLPPGTGWVPTFAAAGTTVLNAWGVTWAEVPI